MKLVLLQLACSIFFAQLCRCASDSTNPKLVLDNFNWTVVNANATIKIPAKVPGSIYTDLERAGVIKDPMYRFGDLETRWISYDNWTYTTFFPTPDSMKDSPSVRFVFEGLDTVSEVRLNDKVILKSDNMFIQYEVKDVKVLLKDKGLNYLAISFTSPVAYGLARNRAQNYTILPECPDPVRKGECHVNLLRKMQSSFTWDWGPAFPTVGIWKSLYLEGLSFPIVSNIAVQTFQNTGDSWKLKLNVYVDHIDASSNGKLNIRIALNDSALLNANQQIKSNNSFEFIVDKHQFEAWYPNGAGNQTLYPLSVVISDGSKNSSKNINIGFRTVELVQDKIGDNGREFYFKINGKPIFAKGSNLIPIDLFNERVTHERIEHILWSAAVQGMNMLRVWGGGIYQDDYFYEVADRLGIMIWHDMMFACALYPTDHDFLDSVTTEITQQIQRLQHHPSIVLWAGNNENEKIVAKASWKGMKEKLEIYRRDYKTLYVDVIRKIILNLDNSRPYVTSSQSNGVETEKTKYWIADDPNSKVYGDGHYYNYNKDGWSYSAYPRVRFMSEYGFQSFPSYTGMLEATDKPEVDLTYPFSELMTNRQHHGAGNDNLANKVFSKMAGPSNALNATESFRVLAYMDQIHQAISVKTETEFYRRGQSEMINGEGHTMGALYWQINDAWQAPTWASTEYSGRWKMLHYYAKLFFAPIIVSPYVTPDDKLAMFVLNDGPEIPSASVEIYARSYSSGQILERKVLEGIKVRGNNSTKLALKFENKKMCRDPAECFYTFEIWNEEDNIGATNFLLPRPPKDIKHLPKADVKIESISPISVSNKNYLDEKRSTYKITLTTLDVALFVWLENPSDPTGVFSDNGFLLYQSRLDIIYSTLKDTTANELMKNITLIHYAQFI